MVRTMTFAVAIFSAAALVAAQAPDKPAPPKGDAPAIQQPAPTTPPSSPGQKPMASAGKVTYTGCVKAGTAADSWILENAEIAGKATAAAGDRAPGDKPAAGVATAGASKTFNLDPAPSVQLKTHANHKVEVEGTLAPSKPGSDRQEFRVESLKMVAATCP